MTCRATRLSSLVLIATLCLSFLVATTSRAAEPSEGTVSLESPDTAWTGDPTFDVYPTGDNGVTNACPPASADPDDTVCDHFTLTVDLEESFWEGKSGGVRVTLRFEPGDDYELAIFRNDEDVAPVTASISANNPEVAFIDKAFGTYEVRISPYLATQPYEAIAELVLQSDVTDPVSPGFQAFHPTVVGDEAPAEDFDNPAASYEGPELRFRSTAVGRHAAEPTVAVDKDGIAYYAAGAFDALPEDSPSNLARTEIYRSSDGGLTWQEVTPQVAGSDQPPTTLDPYVYVEEDSGRVFDVDLLVADKGLWFSDDKGESWTPSAIDLSNAVQDHQTLFAGPVPAGSGLQTLDPAFEEIVYYCFNKIAEATCSRSLDGGQTFQRTGTPAFLPVNEGSNSGIPFCGSLHGHVATDDEGRLFLPKGHCNEPWLGISEDAGTTWDTVKVSDMGFPEQQASVDADSAGNLYYVWYDDQAFLPYLAISRDHGQTWSEPMMIAPPGVREVQWPTVWAGDEGRIAVGFPCGRAEGDRAKLPSRPWDHCLVVSVDALSDEPTFLSNISNAPTDPVHRGECPGRCGNMYDFLDVIVAPAEAGGEVWAAYVDTCTDQPFLDAAGEEFPICNSQPTASGFDGENDNAAGDMDGMVSKQVCGPSLWASIGTITTDCAPAADDGAAPAPAVEEPSGSALPATGGGLALLGTVLAGAALLVRRRRAV